ncbi:MAG TPA: L,D-transpeptidase family protein [Beijerinckiaceae bacterium]|jgi:lipoprotein-anchoring transpeptidase ErfK/SrfK|nr:L,D-transpeptidase family protein [Beijerinckiaceae bacterium]
MMFMRAVASECVWRWKGLAKTNAKPVGDTQGAARGLVVAVAISLLSASCAPHDPPKSTVGDGRYGDEPFVVRIVDRARFEERYRPAEVENTTGEGAGTVVVDTQQKQLFLVVDRNRALRYGVAVGAAGKSWQGTATVGRKAKWPRWYPTDEMRQGAPGLPATIATSEDVSQSQNFVVSRAADAIGCPLAFMNGKVKCRFLIDEQSSY